AVSLRVTDSTNKSIIITTNITIAPTVVRYVDSAAPGAGTGLSWTNAFPSLTTALSAATFGTQLHIAGGHYLSRTSGSQTASFGLKNGVALYGGYAGSASSTPDIRNPDFYLSFLSGNLSYHVVTAVGV